MSQFDIVAIAAEGARYHSVSPASRRSSPLIGVVRARWADLAGVATIFVLGDQDAEAGWFSDFGNRNGLKQSKIGEISIVLV